MIITNSLKDVRSLDPLEFVKFWNCLKSTGTKATNEPIEEDRS